IALGDVCRDRHGCSASLRHEAKRFLLRPRPSESVYRGSEIHPLLPHEQVTIRPDITHGTRVADLSVRDPLRCLQNGADSRHYCLLPTAYCLNELTPPATTARPRSAASPSAA